MSKAIILLLACVAVAGVSAATPFQRLTSAASKSIVVTSGGVAKNGQSPNVKQTPFPFTVCSGAPTDFAVTTLYVTPNPPTKGQNIGMQLMGTVDEQLTSGSNFQVAVLYQGVQIFTETVDMSTATTLPVGPGAVTLNYSVLIPSIAPSGGYVVSITFNDQTGTEIGCISISFNL